jgi:hypothetical protein
MHITTYHSFAIPCPRNSDYLISNFTTFAHNVEPLLACMPAHRHTATTTLGQRLRTPRHFTTLPLAYYYYAMPREFCHSIKFRATFAIYRQRLYNIEPRTGDDRLAAPYS